jgi:hypothetical protein
MGQKRTILLQAQALATRLPLLDDVSNYILLTYDNDLIFGDEEFVCFYLRHFLDHEGWKGVQSNIGWHFVANPNLVGAGYLLDMHVLKIFFYDVILLRRELDGSRRNQLPFVGWRLSNGASDQ